MRTVFQLKSQKVLRLTTKDGTRDAIVYIMVRVNHVRIFTAELATVRAGFNRMVPKADLLLDFC